MTNVTRANRTIEDRARFGVGSDTQDDQTDPATDETQLTAEGVVGASATGLATQTELDAAETTNASYRPLFSVLAADSADVNASVVLVDSGLTVTLGVGTYVWEALLKVTTADAADVRFKPTGTATVTAASSFTSLVAPAAATVGNPEFVAWNTETTVVTGVNAAGAYVLKGTVVTTVAGTLKIQFAQGTSDVSNTHIDSGSYLKAERVA